MKRITTIALVGLLALLGACTSQDITGATIQPIVLGDSQNEFLAGTYNAETGLVQLTDEAFSSIQDWNLSLMQEDSSEIYFLESSMIDAGILDIGDGYSLLNSDMDVVGYLTVEDASWVDTTDEGDVSSFFPWFPLPGDDCL